MKPNRFLNDLKVAPLHTAIGATEQSAATPQSFEERQTAEQQRKFIRSYRDSMLGSRYGVRGSIKVDSRTQNANLQQPTTQPAVSPENRQAFNSQDGHHFSEPTGRSYNPYS